MSSRRVVVLTVVACAGIVGASWAGAASFPLQAAAESFAASAPAAAVANASPSPEQAAPTQAPPRDRRPGEAAPETSQEIELKRAIELNPQGDANLYARLARLQEERGATVQSLRTIDAMLRAFPNDRGPLSLAISSYTKAGRADDAVALVERLAAGDPGDKALQLMVVTYYWELLFKNKGLTPQQSSTFMKNGLDAADRALALDADYVDALVYKNILLRLKANAADPTARQALLAEADALRARALELNRARGATTPTQVRHSPHSPATGMPAPPPPPPPHQFSPLIDGVAPLRVGGQIKPPVKIRDVKPVYPPIALSSGVQGVVIIEATIDGGGDVVDTRVLRGQPLLDEAALDAVRQWRFQPTMLNGAPVPVIMTLTVNFTLDKGPSGEPPVAVATQMAPPPPPPPPAPELVDGLRPVRVGGTIKPPVKTTHVDAVYPADALASGVGGVVILQATIDTVGNVVAAQVLKSIPMLDQAAIDAVEQWKFEPTLLNGVPTPLIMTVTVNFVAR
jgi:TonB family protein